MPQDAATRECTPTKVDHLWFSRDTIVIRAENKIFQVSGALLAARSTVFRDMIAFPQPMGGDTEQFDGSPVVRLHDSAHDVEVFLRAIYDSSYFMPAPAETELSAVLGILRLSNKYDVQYLYRRALEHLAVDGWYAANYDENGWEDHLDSIEPRSPINALSVIDAASEVGATWILPKAYYCASTFFPYQLVPHLEGRMEHHVRKCLLAHVHLVRGTVATHRFLTTYQPCATTNMCNSVRAAHLATFFDDVAKEADIFPLSRWVDDEVWDRLKEQGLCEACCGLATTQNQTAARSLWIGFPTFLGCLPGTICTP
ncbi:hypothetical protein B0H11DRAFT_1721522 [Mycena galericulata]|nr:hypothetical protein B0H11DRAFT_1721522 [Mycena galericulata]